MLFSDNGYKNPPNEKKARSKKSVVKPLFAKHDPVCCLVSGLFRSLKKGERSTSRLDVTYKISETETCRFIGFEPLGIEELRVLQGLAAYCGAPYRQDRMLVDHNTKSDLGQLLRKKAELDGDAVHEIMSVSNLHPYIFLDQLNIDPRKRNFDALMESLLRLSNVTMQYRNTEKKKGCLGWAATHLLSFAVVDEQLFVSLNYRLTQAMLQLDGRQPYTLISMDEVRSIRSCMTRLIHQRLCGWLRQGQTSKVSLEKLMSYAYPDDERTPECTPATRRKRLQRTRVCLEELKNLGWEFEEIEKNVYRVERPKTVKSVNEKEQDGSEF